MKHECQEGVVRSDFITRQQCRRNAVEGSIYCWQHHVEPLPEEEWEARYGWLFGKAAN